MTVVAVLALSPLMSICRLVGRPDAGVGAEPRRDHQHGARVAAVEDAGDVVAVDDVGHEVEVARVDEGGDHLAAGAAAVVVLHGQTDVADVEVERVAVDEQEERRHEEQDQQGPPVAPDLAQLLAGDGQHFPHQAAALRSATSRNTSSSDGSTSVHDDTSRPAARSRGRDARPGRPRPSAARRARRCRRCWSSPLPASRRAPHRLHRQRGVHLDDRPAGKRLLQLGHGAERRQPAAWMMAMRWQCSASSR